MSDPSIHHRNPFVVETIEDSIPPVEPQIIESTFEPETVSIPARTWQPGSLHSSLKNKISNTALFEHAPTPVTDLPSFFQAAHATPAIVDQGTDSLSREATDGELLGFSSLATMVSDKFTNMQSIAMSVPAFITIAL